jgi:hypothetical protein
MDARHPKSGLPDFGTKIVEIGSSRFRLLAAILRDARKSALLRIRSFISSPAPSRAMTHKLTNKS